MTFMRKILDMLNMGKEESKSEAEDDSVENQVETIMLGENKDALAGEITESPESQYRIIVEEQLTAQKELEEREGGNLQEQQKTLAQEQERIRREEEARFRLEERERILAEQRAREKKEALRRAEEEKKDAFRRTDLAIAEALRREELEHE